MASIGGFRDDRPLPTVRSRTLEPLSWIALLGHQVLAYSLDAVFTLSTLVFVVMLYRIVAYHWTYRRVGAVVKK